MAIARIHILIADPSLIIRSGVVSVLMNFNSLRVDIAEVSDMFRLEEEIVYFNPDIVIVNPQYLGITAPHDHFCNTKQVRYIALSDNSFGNDVLSNYNATISILDSGENIEQIITKLISSDAAEQVELSVREREIVRAIAKGMSNKEVADALSISTHTVTTHRRNIASKLGIHNPAGLTIYAIVNGIIDISEAK